MDRREAANDYRINVKADLEIEVSHEKIDQLRDNEVLALNPGHSNLDRSSRKEEIRFESFQA